MDSNRDNQRLSGSLLHWLKYNFGDFSNIPRKTVHLVLFFCTPTESLPLPTIKRLRKRSFFVKWIRTATIKDCRVLSSIGLNIILAIFLIFHTFLGSCQLTYTHIVIPFNVTELSKLPNFLKIIYKSLQSFISNNKICYNMNITCYK